MGWGSDGRNAKDNPHSKGLKTPKDNLKEKPLRDDPGSSRSSSACGPCGYADIKAFLLWGYPQAHRGPKRDDHDKDIEDTKQIPYGNDRGVVAVPVNPVGMPTENDDCRVKVYGRLIK
ncbi:MAG: hypothetical protein GX992_00595 [Clostridium sp.]|nr:hypothetical protein [Clostridium sp.]